MAFRRNPDLGWNIIDALDAEIAVVDGQGVVLAVNAAWTQAPPDQYAEPAMRIGVGENYFCVCRERTTDPEALAVIDRIAAVANGSAAAFSLEYPRQTPDGERWFLLSVTPLPGGAGGAVLSHFDITSRKKTQDALMLNEARFRSLVMHGMEAISIADADGVILYEAPSIERVLGYRPEELVGRTMPGIHPDDLESGEEAVLRAQETPGGYCDFAMRVRHKDGDYRHLEMTVTNMLDNPAVQGMVYNFRDVTEQVLAEAELRFQTQFLDQALVSVIAMTIDGTVTHWNRYAEELYGWTAREAIGRDSIALIVRPIDQERLRGIHDEILRDQGWQGELVLQRKDLSHIDVHANLNALTDEHGRIVGMVCVTVDLRERKRLERQLRHFAVHDPLTGLPNRTLFADRLEMAIRGSVHRGSKIAVLFIDLDRFKLVNDSFGHAAGDIVLQGIANRLSSVLPVSSTLARLGGDEFVVVLEDIAGEAGTRAIAERLRAAIVPPITVGEYEVQVGASIGIALGSSVQTNPESLMREADAALYQAKASGRGGIFFFDRTTISYATRDLRLKRDLRRARARKELLLQYQPIVQLVTGRVRQVEALIRWDHPEYGLVSPAEFIPLAEEMGILVSIGNWVVRETCHQMARWDAAFPDADRVAVAVNLSARQFGEPNLVRDTLAALKDAGIEPSRLILEITEDVLIQDIVGTVQTLRLLRDAGIRVAIDDFGTGYSSLGYLRALPVDGIKLDRAFVAELGTEPGGLAIVEAIIQMAHALDLEVTAEGIETHEQLGLLRGLGCDLGQGFMFSPAVHPEQAWPRASFLNLLAFMP